VIGLGSDGVGEIALYVADNDLSLMCNGTWEIMDVASSGEDLAGEFLVLVDISGDGCITAAQKQRQVRLIQQNPLLIDFLTPSVSSFPYGVFKMSG